MMAPHVMSMREKSQALLPAEFKLSAEAVTEKAHRFNIIAIKNCTNLLKTLFILRIYS
jgi:hypothetical protein